MLAFLKADHLFPNMVAMMRQAPTYIVPLGRDDPGEYAMNLEFAIHVFVGLGRGWFGSCYGRGDGKADLLFCADELVRSQRRGVVAVRREGITPFHQGARASNLRAFLRGGGGSSIDVPLALHDVASLWGYERPLQAPSVLAVGTAGPTPGCSEDTAVLLRAVESWGDRGGAP